MNLPDLLHEDTNLSKVGGVELVAVWLLVAALEAGGEHILHCEDSSNQCYCKCYFVKRLRNAIVPQCHDTTITKL